MPQKYRDIAAVAFFLMVIMYYMYGLDYYLSGLQEPRPMKILLVSSFVFSVFNYLRDGLTRFTVAAILASALVFAICPYLAHEIREIYLSFVMEISHVGAEEMLGADYAQALRNPAIGVGGCFAIAFALLRLPFQTIIYKAVSILYIYSATEGICPTCGAKTITHVTEQ